METRNAYMANLMAARRATFKLKGLCCCGRTKADRRSRCSTCLESRQRSIAKRKSAGLCLRCGKPATGGYVNCDKCAAKYSGMKNGHLATYEDRLALFEAQNRTCPICDQPLLGFIRADHAAIDHDHETGKVRGLVHGQCNRRIGDLDADTSLRIAAYLKLHAMPPSDGS